MQKNIILAVIIGVLGLGSFAAGQKVKQSRLKVKNISPAPAPNLIAKNQFNPGLTIMDFDYNNSKTNKKEIITAAVWYPTKEEPKDYIYQDAQQYQSKVAVNANLAKEGSPYPLIIFSHGLYGSGYNAAYFLEYLARNGYIAVAPDFIDTKPPQYQEPMAFSRIKGNNNLSRLSRLNSLQVLRAAKQFVDDANADTNFLLSYVEKHRLNQTSLVIDKMIALDQDPNSIFYQAVNEQAIGMMGHSLGGLTTLAKTGAYPDKSYTDERIKTALLFSAPAYPFQNNINQIDIPIMIMAGDNDEPNYGPKDVPRYVIYDPALPPKYLLILKDATHFTFVNSGSGQTPLYQAVETVPQTKAISHYGLAFFEKYLKGNTSMNELLNQKDSALTYYIKEEKSGEVSEWGEKPVSQGQGGAGAILEEIRRRRQQ